MPLNRILERVRGHDRAPGAPVVVFDLDSTLYSTQARNHVIVKEYAARAEAPAALREAAARLTVHDMGWNAMDDLRAAGFSDERELKAMRRFWFERFFSSAYLRHDQPMPGATTYVQELVAAGARVVYLTGRPELEMGAGTRASLAAHGFPYEDPHALMLKPTFEENDLVFKTRACRAVHQLGQVVGAFENEPANANLFATEFPHAEVVLLETVHSPGAPPAFDRIHRAKHFHRQR